MYPVDPSSASSAAPRPALPPGPPPRALASPAPVASPVGLLVCRLVEDAAERYFRCHPLRATLSLAQCRANRLKPSYPEALELIGQHVLSELPPDIQPFACWSCSLAHTAEAGGLPFYSRAEVVRRSLPPAVPASEATPAGHSARPHYRSHSGPRGPWSRD